MTTVNVELDFHSAGQGLFATGELFLVPANKRAVFRWVYDCGSSAGRKDALKGSIDDYANRLDRDGEDVIDLVVISHFDRDHVNGLIDLLDRVKIRTLLLPLISISTRIAVLLAEGDDADSNLASLLFEPASFLASNSRDGRGVAQIVLIPPSSGSSEGDPAGFDGGGAPSDDGVTYPIDPRSSEIIAANGLESNAEIEMRVAAERGVIRVMNCWEFVPYNDASVAPLEPGISSQIELTAEKFKSTTDKRVRASLLIELKKIYENTYPTGEMRNRISLFVYGGPTSTRLKVNRFRETIVEQRSYSYSEIRRYTELALACGSDAVIYTGDGYLDTMESIRSLREYFGAHRMDRLCVFQVMHHGSKNNWFPGLADELSPAVSVFSSDPSHHHGHPHAEVLRDFWEFNSLQVDRKRCVKVFLYFEH